MDGGKSGILSVILLVGILVISLFAVAQKNRTEDRLKKINESLTSMEDELKKNIRDVSQMKGDFGSITDNFRESKLNLKDLETESKVLGTRFESVTGSMEKLAAEIRELAKEVNSIEIRAARAEETAGKSSKNGDEAGERKGTDSSGKPGDGVSAGSDGTGGRAGSRPKSPWGPQGPTRDEADRLWEPDANGIVRPVIDDYTAGEYNPALNGGTLMAMLGTDPKGFNPLTENSDDVSYLQSYCWPSLCGRLRLRPEIWVYDLAESCEISDDFKVYTFRVRKGVKWQKPIANYADQKYAWLRDADREVTARDFQFFFEMMMNQQVQCTHARNYYQDIEKVEVLDRYSLRITWKRKVYQSITVSLGFQPLAEFLYAYDENGNRFPDESIGLDFNTHWYNNKIISCGQFLFHEWNHGVSVTLVKNPDYYGRPANIEKIVYMIIREDDQALLNIKNHEVQISGIRMAQYKQEVIEKGDKSMFFKRGEEPVGNQKIMYDFYDRFGYYYFGWNLENPKFKDKRVRNALTYACPRRKILQEIWVGLGEVVTGEAYYRHPYYNPNIKEHPYDLEKAKQLLSEAGWFDTDGNGILDKIIEDKKVEFEFKLLLYGNSKEWQSTADAYKESLRKIGITLNVEVLDWALMQEKMEAREFEAYSGGWALAWEVDPYQIWHSSQANEPKSSNMVSFRNAEADKIIEEGRVTFSEARRREIFWRFHEIVHDEQPYTFLFCLKAIPVWWQEVKGVQFSLIRPQSFKGNWYLNR